MTLIIPISIALAAGCATTGRELDPSVRVTISETTPAPGARLDGKSVVRVVANYSLAKVEPGKDQIRVAFKTVDGHSVEPSHYVLSKSRGQVTFEVACKQLLWMGLEQPLKMYLVLDRWEGPGSRRALAISKVVTFDAQLAKFLPPGVGKDLLLTDVRNDRRYKSRFLPKLDRPGMVVSGMFKLCVDEDGQMFSVNVLKSADPFVDADWMALMHTWQHRPYTIGGRPVPYCYPMRLEVRSQN
jgi:hypothetical protein